MRLQSEIKVIVKDKVIGGPDYLVCLPLVAEDKPGLLGQAKALRKLDPDLVEVRFDGYGKAENIDENLEALKELRAVIPTIPLVFTCRIDREGGYQCLSRDVRLNLLKGAVQTAAVDIVDIEMSNGAAFIDEVMQASDRHGVKLVLSYHNFNETPDGAFILDKLLEAQKMGAHIAKIAVMPKDHRDPLILLEAALTARTGRLKIPMIAVSMGAMGGITRLAGGLFGSDISFAAGTHASAAGQIPIGDFRQAMKVIY